MVTLKQEVQSLRREVRGQRDRQRRSLMVAVIAVLIAAVSPVAAFAANSFNDLVGGSPHNGNIDAIYNAGITTGCVPNQSYCPTDLVTRQEMASFLARTAGLGGNQPVTNARTVQGFQANALSRINVAGSGSGVFAVSNAYQAAAQTTIAVPGPGFVLVSGAITFNSGSPSTDAIVSARLIDYSANIVSLPISAAIGQYQASAFAQSLSPVTVFAVNAPGTRTFGLEGVYANTGPVQARSAIITALYVPFGPGGVQGAEIDTPNQPANIPQSWP